MGVRVTSEPQRDEPHDGTEADHDHSLESPEADSAEQDSGVTSGGDKWSTGSAFASDSEVSEGDAVEQLREVEFDEDEYR